MHFLHFQNDNHNSFLHSSIHCHKTICPLTIINDSLHPSKHHHQLGIPPTCPSTKGVHTLIVQTDTKCHTFLPNIDCIGHCPCNINPLLLSDAASLITFYCFIILHFKKLLGNNHLLYDYG